MIDLVDKHFLNRGHGAEFEMEARWVQDHIPGDAARILEIGCGIGGLFEVIGLDRMIGTDISAAGLTHTRERAPNVPLVCAEAPRLPFADGSFDVIALQHVVEHLAGCEHACREWHRTLKPGGVLLVVTPNGLFCDPAVHEDPTHVHVFAHDDLGRLLVETGFAIVELRTLGLPWFRRYHLIPLGWRLRRFVTGHAEWLSGFSPWRWKGQTLCCAARRLHD